MFGWTPGGNHGEALASLGEPAESDRGEQGQGDPRSALTDARMIEGMEDARRVRRVGGGSNRSIYIYK